MKEEKDLLRKLERALAKFIGKIISLQEVYY